MASAQRVTRAQLIEALKDAAAHLAGAASAYEHFAGNVHRAGKRDALYSTRVKDFDRALSRSRRVLRKVLNEKPRASGGGKT